MSNIQKHKTFQQPINNQYKTPNNQIHKNLNHNKYKQNIEKIPSSGQKYVLRDLNLTNSLFDEKSANSALGFIPPEPDKQYRKNQNMQITSLNNIQGNSYKKVGKVNSNSSRNKKSPVDEISINSSSNNRNIQPISPSNSDREMNQVNLRNKKLDNTVNVTLTPPLANFFF